MRKLNLSLIAFAALASVAMAGTEYSGKEMQQSTAVQPQECFYADNEWDVSLWGAYAFTGHKEKRVSAEGFFFGDGYLGDRYLETDHAWGGGGDIKYFMHKYFGLGVEGFALDAKRTEFGFNGVGAPNGTFFSKTDDHRTIGAVLGTFTLRYPIGCSRFAPYVWGGGGGIFGGGQRDTIVSSGVLAPTFTTTHSNGKGKGMGQVGGGIEVRITRHIGWLNDFSWNMVDGPNNNFGMVRSGLTFAF
jgi:hypothetical protein